MARAGLAIALTVAFIAMAGPSAATQPTDAKPASAVPEPTDLALFAVGVVGLIIGRRGSRSNRRGD